MESESGRKATEEWLGLDCKLAAGAQILGQGTENEAIDSTRQLRFRRDGMEWNWGEWNGVEMSRRGNGGFVREKER